MGGDRGRGEGGGRLSPGRGGGGFELVPCIVFAFTNEVEIRAGQSMAEQSRAGQSRIEQGRARQSRAEQGRAEQGRVGQSRAEQGRVIHHSTPFRWVYYTMISVVVAGASMQAYNNNL